VIILLAVGFCLVLAVAGLIKIPKPHINVTWSKLEFDINLGKLGVFHIDTGLWIPTGIDFSIKWVPIIGGSQAQSMWSWFKDNIIHPIVNAVIGLIRTIENAIVGAENSIARVLASVGADPYLAHGFAIFVLALAFALGTLAVVRGVSGVMS